MRFEILGPIRVRSADRDVAITAHRDLVLLAMLLIHPDYPVSVPLLIETIWIDRRPPRDARNQLQGCVSRLRRQLGEAGVPGRIIVTEPTGYRICPEQADVSDFRQLLARARAAAADGRIDESVNQFRAGLSLWRGPALDGIENSRVQQVAATLDEERIQALEECLHLELASGRGGDLVPELTDLVGQYPYREGLVAARMLALHRAGRQADALTAYRHTRQLMHDELGVEPGAELQQLHLAILNHDPDVGSSRATPASRPDGSTPAPRQLPASIAGFTGRADALKMLDELLPLADGLVDAPSPPVVATVSGTAGVGKTALAVRWAHRVADRFPDGQLYLELRGASATPPLHPVEALAALLRSLGTPPDQVPAEQPQAAALFRSRVAGRRVLMVLDDAASVDQVRPLLPGSGGCLVLITSRDRLTGLAAREGARRLTLDVLTPEEAHTLLGMRLGAARVGAEPTATAELARACAYLPLALRIAAANLADRTGWTISGYLAELLSGDRLTALQADGDAEAAVRGAVDLSYQRVPDEARRLFRLLGLVPGADVRPAAAAALAATTVADAERLMGRLARAHLVHEHSPGRYTFHDLLRLYARQLANAADSDERDTATEHMLAWYLHGSYAAVTLLYPQMMRLPAPPPDPAVPQPEFHQPAAALAWLDAERANLVAAVEYAAAHGPRPHAWQLAACLRRYFLHGQHAWDWQTVATAALTAAQQEGDLPAQAGARLSMADLDYSLARYPDAIAHYERAVALARQGGWVEGQVAARSNLGRVYWSTGQLQQAAEHFAKVLTLCRENGWLDGVAINGNSLGIVDRERGRLRQAVDQHSRALSLYQRLGRTVGEADTLGFLGAAHHELGWLSRAQAQLASALAMHRELGDRGGAATDLAFLAAVQRDAGALSEALEQAQEALAEAAADPAGQARALNVLGSVQLLRRLPQQALDHHQHALNLARPANAHRAETIAQLGLASASYRLGQHESQADHASHALELARRAGYRVLEGLAEAGLAQFHVGRRDLAQAREHARRALDNHRHTGHRLGEAQALYTLGQIREQAGDAAGAARCWSASRTLLAEIGAMVPPELSDSP